MNNKDNEETMIFTPVEKQADSDENALEFNDDYIEEELMNKEEPVEKGNKALIYTLVILCILLVIAISAVFLLLSTSSREKNENQNQGGDIILEEKEPSEEKEEEEEAVEIISCSIVFYGESAVESDEGYVITAKVTDNKTQRQKKKHLLIDDDTEIRINGKRVAPDSFIYLLEEKNEEALVFDSKVDEENEYITYISFDGDLSEKEEEEEEPPAEETEENPEEEEIIEGINLQE